MSYYSKSDNRGPGSIPSRWLHCPRKGLALVVDKFLAFKTPLNNDFNEQVPEQCRFPPSMLFGSMKSYRVRIGLWIDLTNTSRFYDKDEVKHGYNDGEVAYMKLNCRGHGETPSVENTELFIKMCKNFISKHPLDIIGVHCTHGFNRTGFLLVCYMVEEMDFSVQAAIIEFAKARPPGIYKPDYLEELFRRYDEVQFTPAPPPLPSWCTESDDSISNNVGMQEMPSLKSRVVCGPDGGAPVGRKRKREINNRNPVFMEGVPGVMPVTRPDLVSQIQIRVQEMCGWNASGFPGCQPVSMDINNISHLKEKPYMVSWKADGTRYMMAIFGEKEVYFLDRDNSVFQVSGIKIPNRKDPQKNLTRTLLDGEMVIDKHEGKNYPRYLVYDIVVLEGRDVAKEQFNMRLSYIDVDIIKSREKAMKEGRIDKASEPFSIRLKMFYPVEKASSLLSEKFAKQLTHEPDGLIFQPLHNAYTTGQCMEVLKWKPATHNSVDFRLKIVKEQGEGILSKRVGYLYVGGMDLPFSKIKLSHAIKELDKKIIECKFENNNWVLMRERTDKSFPNSHTTAKSVCQSIQNPVTTEMLLQFIDRYRYRNEEEKLMPPPKRPRS